MITFEPFKEDVFGIFLFIEFKTWYKLGSRTKNVIPFPQLAA